MRNDKKERVDNLKMTSLRMLIAVTLILGFLAFASCGPAKEIDANTEFRCGNE